MCATHSPLFSDIFLVGFNRRDSLCRQMVIRRDSGTFMSMFSFCPIDGSQPFNYTSHWLGLVSRLFLLTKPNQCELPGACEVIIMGA